MGQPTNPYDNHTSCQTDKELEKVGPCARNFHFDSCLGQLELTNNFVVNLHMIEAMIHLCSPMARLALRFMKRQISLLSQSSLSFSAWVKRIGMVNCPCTHVLIQGLSISAPSLGRKLLARKIKLGPSAFF